MIEHLKAALAEAEANGCDEAAEAIRAILAKFEGEATAQGGGNGNGPPTGN